MYEIAKHHTSYSCYDIKLNTIFIVLSNCSYLIAYICVQTQIYKYMQVYTHLSFEDTNTLSPQPCFLQNYALCPHHFLGELQLHHTSTLSPPFRMFFAVVITFAIHPVSGMIPVSFPQHTRPPDLWVSKRQQRLQLFPNYECAQRAVSQTVLYVKK